MDENNRETGWSWRRPQCPMEDFTPSFQSVETVRTLHQTIVGLRTALEDAKLEIHRLRTLLEAQTEINDNYKFELFDKRFLPFPEAEEERPRVRTRTKPRYAPTTSTTLETIRDEKEGEVKEELKAGPSGSAKSQGRQGKTNVRRVSIAERKDVVEQVDTFEHLKRAEESNLPSTSKQTEGVEEEEVEYHPQTAFVPDVRIATRRRMASKIDINIKVRNKLNVQGTNADTSSSSQPSSARSPRDENSSPKGGDDSSIKSSEDGIEIKEIADTGASSTPTDASRSDGQDGDGDVRISEIIIDDIEIDGGDVSTRQIAPDQIADDQTLDIQINDAQTGDIQVCNAKTSDDQISDTQISDVRISTAQIGDSQVNDVQVGDSQISDAQVRDTQVDLVHDSNVQVSDTQVMQVSDDQVGDAQIANTQIGAEQISKAEANDIRIEDAPSASGSENSVFFEDKPQVEASAVDDKAPVKGHDSKEEVDDIELIFSSDENRDPIQEDLVSISEYDPWQPPGMSGTPVLLKFSSLRYNKEEETSDSDKSIPPSISHDAVYTGLLSQDVILPRSDRTEGPRVKSTSFERETSRRQKDTSPSIGRDESMDFFDQKDSSFNRKWTNYNVIMETDISKCGIAEETTFEMYRRNTCPNPPAYRPLSQRDTATTTRHVPAVGSKYTRRTGQTTPTQSPRSGIAGTKRSSAAQTVITALPDHWKSESQLSDSQLQTGGPFTLPSKFTPSATTGGCHKHVIRNTDRTQEARRVLLSDINFTSMVPELSRSADHLCPEKGTQSSSKPSPRYYKGSHLKTPDYALKGMTPSASMTSPCVSQWTVNENSLGTQTTQTVESWGKRVDSFDSCRSYSVGSRFSGLDRSHRSRSVPSIRCAVCRLAHGIRTSESMHYTPRVTFQEPACKIRGSLPDLRHHCVCSKRYRGRSIFTIHGDSSGSTESLIDEADTFVRKSMESAYLSEDITTKKPNLRRMSENDIQRDYTPSKQSLPFLPKTAKCLKPGHLAKVISKNGRVVVGRVRYVGPLATVDTCGNRIIDDLYVGVQLQSKCGDCDGTYEGRKFFDCEPLQGLFVPFKKVVMAWAG